MASSVNNVIEDRVKRCKNGTCVKRNSRTDNASDALATKGSHLKKREQHSCRNFPGLPPPSRAFRSSLDSETSPSEDGDVIETAAAPTVDDCDMESRQATETMKQPVPSVDPLASALPHGAKVDALLAVEDSAKPLLNLKNGDVRLNGVMPQAEVVMNCVAPSSPAKEVRQADKQTDAKKMASKSTPVKAASKPDSKSDSKSDFSKAASKPDRADKVSAGVEIPSSNCRDGEKKHRSHKSDSQASKSGPKEKTKHSEPPDKKQKLGNDSGTKGMGLLLGSRACPECEAAMTLQVRARSADGYSWRCGVWMTREVPKRKPVKVQYLGEVSVRSSSFFEGSHLTLPQLMKIIYLWCQNLPCAVIQRETDVAKMIGGEGVTVELDESMFGRRKYHRGYLRPGQRVFGGVEHGSGYCFLVPVETREAKTLLGLIANRPAVLLLTHSPAACLSFVVFASGAPAKAAFDPNKCRRCSRPAVLLLARSPSACLSFVVFASGALAEAVDLTNRVRLWL
ncbi:hypothetical protein ISCGN_010350 [Ixodes scapularis]